MNKKWIANCAALFLLVMTLTTSPTSQAAVGSTVGAGSVSALGAGNYSIPLTLPPGTHGMTPSLSLNYDSGSGNGVIGVGWSIGGLSAISRCGRTWAQDGESRDIRRDYSDRFCLNGNKLRLTSGSYGAAGATYQTEIANFSVVTSLGTAGNGPESFTVQGRDGVIYEYGNTLDSRFKIVNFPEMRTWALNKVTDTAGNAMLFTYTPDTTNGSYRIATVQYTSNATQALAAAYTVEFVYETRPSNEIDIGYVAGGVVKEITRLIRVDVKYNTAIVRRYSLTFESALSSTSKSRLASIQECAGSPLDCFPATTFTYQNGAAGLGAETNTSVAMPATPWATDVNGDGRDDLVYPSNATSGSGTWMVMLANSSGGYASPINTGVTNTNYAGAILIDYNADGLGDLLVPYSGGTWWVMLGTNSGAGLLSPTNTSIAATATGNNARAFDVNGDGLDDLVWAQLGGYGADFIYYRLRDLSGTFSSTIYTLAAAASDETFSANVFGAAGQTSRTRVPDFNGDGRGDLVYRKTWRRHDDDTGDTFTRTMEVAYTGAATASYPDANINAAPYFGDFNGDGKTDLFYLSQSGYYVYRLSSGTGLTAAVTAASVAFIQPVILDWDGDGYDDLLLTSGGILYVLRSTGEGFGYPLASPVSTGMSAGTLSTVADINGDGLMDLASNVSGTWRFRAHAGAYPDLLQTATDGLGSSITFSYAPLSSANYSKDSGASFPEQDYKGSMYVVNSYAASNGIGGTFTNSFWYYGARLHLQGRGLEGFSARRSSDSRNGLYAYQYFRHDFPYTGTQYQQELYQSNGSTLIRYQQSTLATTTLDSTTNNQRYFPYISSSTANSYEFGGTRNGQQISTTGTNYTFDTAGNATNIATTVTDTDTGSPHYGHEWSTTTTSTISPQAGCLGLPTQVTVTNTAPAVAPLTRTTGYTPNYTYCRMSQVVVEPASATYKVTQDLAYDGFGNVNSQTVTGVGMTARTTGTNWGATGQFPVSVTNPLSQVTQMSYDYALGVQTSQTDPNILIVNWGYDGFGRRTSELRPDGTATTTAYALCSPSCINSNHCMTVTQTANNVGGSVLTDEFTYLDQLGRPLATSQRLLSGAYNFVETRYDALGRVSQQSVPCAASSCTAYWATFAYDAVNRLIQQQRPISATNATLQTNSVDYRGLTTISTDPQGKTTTKIGSVAGTMTRSQDHNGYYQGFTYDAFGSLVSVSDSLSNTLFSATYDYGAQAFQRTIADMDLGTRSYNYNALGEMTAGVDGKSQPFSATFDQLSRPKTRTESEGVTTWSWDGVGTGYLIGKMSSVTSPGYAESYTYDNKGRVTVRRVVTDQTYDFDYSYSATTGLTDTVTYPVSTSSYRLKLQYLYQNGILQQVKDFNASTIFWQANTTNPSGQVTQETLGSGVVTNRNFDAVTGWVNSIQSGVGSGAALQNESYLFDLVGNVTQRQNSNAGLTENFYYDNLYRLDHSVLGATTNLSLTYDAMGNITSRSDIASGAAWTYDATKKHAVRQAGSTSYTYTYDANGNAQTRNGFNITWTSYNYPSVINGPNKTMTFSYGPNRQRFRQVYTNGSTTETTMYVGGMLEKVTSAGVTDWRHYISANGHAVAVMSRLSSGTNATRYVLEDHQGSIAQITDGAGVSYVAESFTAFGARRDAGNWSSACNCTDLAKMKGVTRKGYTGQEAIGGVSMGLNHMNGRVQDAITGRFLSPDPYISEPENTQNYNRYSYVGNNPLSLVDPTGFTNKDRPNAAREDGTISSAEEAAYERGQAAWGLSQMASGGGGGWGHMSDFGPSDSVVLLQGFTGPTNVLERRRAADAAARARVHGSTTEITEPDGTVTTGVARPGFWESVSSTVGGTGSFLDAYFDRVGGMLYGMADSFKITGEAGPQIKGSVNFFGIKPEVTLGSFSGSLSLTGAGDLTTAVKSPYPGSLYYGEVGLSVGALKVGAGLDSVTEGISTRSGPFQHVEQGFFGKAQVTTWKSDFGKVGAHVQVFFGLKVEWDAAKFFGAIDHAFDP